jgi:hypothetical protein
MQAHLDPGVQQEMANRLCALEPISRHDIGQNSYRIKQVFDVMGDLRAHLASMNPYLSAADADIEALQACPCSSVCCSSTALDGSSFPVLEIALVQCNGLFSSFVRVSKTQLLQAPLLMI